MNRVFWTELWFFLLVIMAGFLLTALVSVAVAMIGNTTGSVFYLHVIQWLQTLFVMILPAMLWCQWRCKDSFVKALSMENTAKWTLYLIVGVVTLLCLPLLEILADACRNLPLPDALLSIAEEESKEQEMLLEKMLNVDGFGGWFELVLLMSIFTAIGEELTFRGALLTIFRRYSSFNKHVNAILIGLIFSIIHMDLYGLIPRWILGTVFVYLVYYSGCIWPSVLVHAINNLYALLQYKGVVDF